MTDTVVIGGGLFGQVIAAKLRVDGHSVAVIDSNEQGSGSRPAACLMKPSWYSGLGRDIYEPSLRVLDDLYGIQDVDFRVGPATVPVHWIPPHEILKPHVGRHRVTNIELGGVAALDLDGGTRQWTPRNIVIAAGVWSSRLAAMAGIHVEGLSARAGAAFLWPGTSIKQPIIKPWAPYRQLVAFNRGDGLWAGDGTAVKEESWCEDREQASFKRCHDELSRHEEVHGLSRFSVLWGRRPYMQGVRHAHLVCRRQGGSTIWVATAGAKNGTIGAGYCAHIISRALQ